MAKREKDKLSGLKEDGSPNAYWRKFKERLDSYDKVPVSDWKEEQVLGHILKRYKDNMGSDFTLSYSGPPTKCKEIYCVRRLLAYLSIEDGETLKKYIDWVFDTIIIPNRTAVASIAFFFTMTFILKFKASLRKERKISRTSLLPKEYFDLISPLDISTYGDLAFAKRAIDQDPSNEDLKQYQELFSKMVDQGFDMAQLSSLES